VTILLAQMVSERRDALFALGREYGEARVISSVHYPSYIEAGRMLETMLVAVMQEDRRFRADFAIARRERSVL
jgi:acid phosphatase (class A)